MAWTPEQLAALTNRGGNLLLSAAAGSGKTAVLVERIIRRLLDEQDPVEITDLLVMTFTRAAAAEMRARVGTALAKAEAENPSPRLERQLALVGSAQISTIHAFCTQVIRQYFYRLDLDAGYRQGSETELALWRAQALDDVMLANYETGDPDFYFLADAFRRQNEDQVLRETILRLYDYSRSMPFPDAWLDSLPRPYLATRAELETPLAPLLGTWHADWEQAERELNEIWLAMQGVPELKKAAAILGEDLGTVRGLLAADDWDAAYARIHGVEFARWPSNKVSAEIRPLKDAGKAGRDRVKELVKTWAQGFLGQAPDQWAADLQAMHAPVCKLIAITKEFAAAFTAYKKKERLIDFSDLEHLCLSLLLDPASTPDKPIPSATARELAARYAEVMVDEYQDTNGVQELIATLVSRADNRFMVGDVKQSIYRFRLADPSIFMQKYETYRADDELHKRIDLSRNFRSDPVILGAVNDIFRQVMHRPHADLDYGPAEALYAGREVQDAPAAWVGGTVDLRLLYPDGSEAADPDAEELNAIEAQAQAVAAEILRLKQSGALVQNKKGEYVPMAWRDITVLMRSVSDAAEPFVDAFRRAGIPVYAEQAGGYFAAVEVQVVLALLAVIDNGQRNLDMAAVLRSPLVGWDERSLARVRLAHRDEALGEVIAAAELSPELRAKTDRFLAHLEAWRSDARNRGVAALLRRIYEDTGYPAYVGGLPEGNIRRANLEALYRRAGEFDDSPGTGLAGFLRYIHRLRGEDQDLAIPTVIGEGEDVVRIMTIHKSKGLEFPVVFVVRTEKKFNLTDLSDRVLLHREAGLGIYRYRREEEIAYPTVLHYILRDQLRRESLAEEQRLLYVAMTRARDKLYLYGYLNNFVAKRDELLAGWANDTSGGAAANSYLDWLMPSLSRYPAFAAYWPDATHNQDYEGRWDLRFEPVYPVVRQAEITTEDPLLQAVREKRPTGVELPAAIRAKLAWNYLRLPATLVPAKLTVTEITHHSAELAQRTGIETITDAPPSYALPDLHGEPATPAAAEPVRLIPELPADIAEPDTIPLGDFERVPAFLAPAADTGAAGRIYGTLIHRVLEYLAPLPAEALPQALDQLAATGKISAAERRLVAEADLVKWAQHPVAQRLRAATEKYSELPFSLLLPATKVFADAALHDDHIFLQGVIDSLFIEDGEIVILDYKTDRVATTRELYDEYHRQLDLYAYAAARILGKQVKEKILYSVRLGEAYSWT